MTTLSCPKYPAEVEAAIDRLIIKHLRVSHTYLSLSFYFESQDVALDGRLDYFFRKLAEEKRRGAQRLLINNQLRCQSVSLGEETLSQNEWHDCQEAMEAALVLEKSLNQDLLDLHSLSLANAKPLLCSFLEKHFLEEEVSLIKKMADCLTNLRRLSSLDPGLAEYLFRKFNLDRE